MSTNPDYSELQNLQREYFQILDETFNKATSCNYGKFCRINDFSSVIKKYRSHNKVNQLKEGLEWGYKKLHEFCSKDMVKPFNLPKKIGGMKLLLGGSSRFNIAHFNSVRKMLLYADTILIPDPILPWIEIDRKEERFKDVLFLETIFTMLHLKPLADADLACPAIVVFPSWEKLLEQNDSYTQSGIEILTTNFLAHFMGMHFKSSEDLIKYVKVQETDFLNKVEVNNLFFAPGQKQPGKIGEALSNYRNFLRQWRSPEFVKKTDEMSNGEMVLLGIKERLAPQFHLFENAEELQCQPMLCMDVHWHYYSLCSRIYEEKLQNMNFLKPETVMAIRSLNENRFQWLGNIPIPELVELRINNENANFRKIITEYTNQLHAASLDHLDKVANEVTRAISSLLADHQIEIQKIQNEYKKKHLQTLALAVLTAPAIFLPVLAPFTGIAAPLAIANKYFWNKIDERDRKRTAAKSLTGILAKAAKQ